MTTCLDHSGHIARIVSLEQTTTSQWKAIEGIRVDIKGMLTKIGVMVGGISVINSLVIGVTVYYLTRG